MGFYESRKGRNRIQWIDASKAFAVWLVVLGHVLLVYGDGYTMLGSIIYLFHMPFFFMISGINHAISQQSGEGRQKLLKREINLFFPAVFFMVFDRFLMPQKDIFDYYNYVWFPVFLALILLMEYMLVYLDRRWLYTVPVLLWGMFGICQVLFIANGHGIIARLACMVSKFFGYYMAFRAGILFERYKDTIVKSMKPYIVFEAVWIGLVYGCFRLNLQENIALTKIPLGIMEGGIILSFYCQKRKKSMFIENIFSKYSLEIYLIHVNVIHEFILPFIRYDNAIGVWRIIFAVLLLAADFAVPLLIVVISKKVRILDAIFHPAKYIKINDG